MAVGYSQVKRKAEDAMAVVITDRLGQELSGITLYKGYSGADLATPRIEILAQTADPEDVGGELPTGGSLSGNWNVTIQVTLIQHYADDRSIRAQRDDRLFDILMQDNLVELLNEADVDHFKVWDRNPNGGAGWTPGAVESIINAMQELGEQMTGTMYCCPGVEL